MSIHRFTFGVQGPQIPSGTIRRHEEVQTVCHNLFEECGADRSSLCDLLSRVRVVVVDAFIGKDGNLVFEQSFAFHSLRKLIAEQDNILSDFVEVGKGIVVAVGTVCGGRLLNTFSNSERIYQV